MPIRADASRAKSRIRQATEAIRLAPYALSEVAVSTIADVSNTALERLAPREDQVGFNLAQFIRNISSPGPLQVSGARGTVGILHEPTMGTVGDYEAIAVQDKVLWHEHTGRGDLFKKYVYDDIEVREELARDRESVWGSKTPQWYLMENGYSGAGAYPEVPASRFIATSTRADRMALKLRNAMTSLFKGIPRR